MGKMKTATKEILEILSYLSRLNGYTIFGSMAVHVYTKLPHSLDVDVFIDQKRDFEKTISDFVDKNWRVIERKSDPLGPVATLKKGMTTFDVFCFGGFTKTLKRSRQRKNIYGYPVFVTGLEDLILMKLRTITNAERDTRKRVRDMAAAFELMKKTSIRKILKIFKKRISHK
jgi:predicted nucleotidyltransferase